MRSALILALVLVFPALSLSATINIPADYATIQEGIDAAVHGDTVLVAEGTYMENINFNGKAITVKSAGGPVDTVIDGNQTGSVAAFLSEEGAYSVLDGFTLTNGSGTQTVWHPFGGAVYCHLSSPTIVNNNITGNSAYSGGGIYCEKYSSPTIDNNNISDNSADYRGGGIFYIDGDTTITNNTITFNRALEDGGGLYEKACTGTIMNNIFSGNEANEKGGGIFSEKTASTIANNIFTANEANLGGGIHIDDFQTIRGNMISNNKALQAGGGIFCYWSFPIITNNTITENWTVGGGGIFCENSEGIIANNTVSNNDGGGIFCCFDSDPTIDNNTICGNTTQINSGCGIHCSDSSPTITNNAISGNTTIDNGGGISCVNSSPIITNNTITANMASIGGGGIYCVDSFPTITNNAITANMASIHGGGIHCSFDSNSTITNTILWDNSAPAGPEIWIGVTTHPSTLTISYSDVKGGQSLVHVDPGCNLNWGAGMIDDDPQFVDPANDDYHILYTSPCRDTGDSSIVTELYDFEDDPRITYRTVDMGADEFHPHLYFTGNTTAGGFVTINTIGGLPWTSPVFLFFGSGILPTPMQTKYGWWYMEEPLVFYNLGMVPMDGLWQVWGKIPEYPLHAYYFQALIGNTLTNHCVMEID